MRGNLLSALVLSLAVASIAYAAVPEICGDGIDDPLQTGGSANGTKGSCPAGYMDAVIGSGCDKKCPGVDQDDDGYTSDGTTGNAGGTSIDCDDADKTIYPGVYTTKGCSGGQYRKCQTDGTYTACTSTTLAEGAHANYYIDCGAGNDANAGTHGSPFKTLGKVSGGSGGSGLPASPVTLQADDYVYIQGTSACTTTITASTAEGWGTPPAVLAEINVSGSSGHPIVFRMYPGSTATLSNTNGPGIVGVGSYIDIQGSSYTSLFDISTQRTTASNASAILFANSTRHHIDGVYVHDTSMEGNNNDACVHFTHSNDGELTHSFLKNCRASSGTNPDNIIGVSWLDDAGASEGANHAAYWNTVWMTSYDELLGMMCFKQKHGPTASDVGSNKHKIMWNTCINGRRCVWWDGSSARISDNLLYGCTDHAYYGLQDGSPGQTMEDNEFTHNTVIASGSAQWSPIPYISTSQKLTFDSNVFYDTRTAYVNGNNEGIYSIDGYGSNGLGSPSTDPVSHRTSFEANNNLVSDHNCFYNPNLAPVLSYFNQATGATGGQWSLAQWQSNIGKDANSFVENPSFDANNQATSTHCSTFGRRYTATAGPTPTPTPTPTPAPAEGTSSVTPTRWKFVPVLQ